MTDHQNSPTKPARDSGRPLQSAAVLEDLQPVLPLIYEAFERAIEESKSFFKEGKGIDPFLFPNLVRYYALEYLESGPWEIDDFSIDRLSNNGIFLRFKDYRIRVWKADEGELPAPGTSESKRIFYEQPDLWEGMRFVKLAIIWDTTSKGTLKNLILACPNGDGSPNTAGQAHWQIEIPHPATHITAATAFQDSDDDLILEKPTSVKKATTDNND